MGLLAQSGCLLLRCRYDGFARSVCLIKARKSRGADYWDEDDYDVRNSHGKVVGRIMLHDRYSIPTKPDSSCHSIRERMENLSEWELKLLHFLLTLNQRVAGSSPAAPTI
jgi:hypothetical protein